MNVWYSFFITIILFLIGYYGSSAPNVFGIIIPYIAISIFVLGIIYRVVKWARAPVPFRLPTTSGQQKSLPWIKANNLESPYNIWGVFGRMLLEILFFRSLFRNTKVELRKVFAYNQLFPAKRATGQVMTSSRAIRDCQPLPRGVKCLSR